MLINKTVKLKWNSKIKKHYESLGYNYTKMGDEFEVNIEHLTHGSAVLVDLKCDYCGRTYSKKWYNYLMENSLSNIHKDCCIKCRKDKIKESVLKTYGTTNILKLDNIKEQIKNTNIKKYGVENPFSSKEIQKRIYNTNIERYGVKNPLKNQDILNKVSNTCMKKYGVRYYVQTQVYRGKDSPRWKGGVALMRDERLTYRYRKWRKNVFDRDSYTCQCCKIKNGNGKSVKLNAHHIRNWKDNINLRYDIDNGITMCEGCHNLFHSIYGKRNNNIKQLIDFLLNYGKKVC